MPFQLEPEAQKVLKLYKKIYMFIFVLGMPILSFVFGGMIFVYMQQNIIANDTNQQALRSLAMIKQEKKYITEYQNFVKNSENIDVPNLDMIIRNGDFDTTGNTVISMNNLIQYKGLIMPRRTQLSKISALQNKSFFSQPYYNLSDLSYYLEKVIFSIPDKIVLNQQKRNLITIPNNDLVGYFSLGCTKSNLSNEVCSYYIDQFLSVIHIYDLSKDYNGLNNVFQNIRSDSKIKSGFCISISKYIQYANDSNILLQPIFESCGDKDLEVYNLLGGFFSTEEDLKNQTPTSTAFKQQQTNEYKLVSLMQIINYELNKKRLNQPRITIYLQFVEELLKKDGVEHVYKDLIFLFNNVYLKTMLNSPSIASSSSKKDEVDMLQAKIREINIGSKLKGYIGLDNQIFNKQLTTLVDQEDLNTNIEGNNNTNTMLDRFNTKFTFESLVTEDVQQEGEYIVTKGKMLFQSGDSTNRLDVGIVFGEYQGMFVVKKIYFTGYPKINQVLENITKNNNMTIAKIYAYIQDYSDMLFSQDPGTVSLCDMISDIQGLKNCIDGQIDIESTFSGENVLYSFVHQNGVLKNIIMTNKELEQKVRNEFSGLQTTENDIKDSILMVLKRIPPIEKIEITDDTAQSDRLIIDSDFETYFGKKTDGIITRDGTTVIMFNIDSIDFICIYDIGTKNITDLFFKKVGPSQKFSNINIKLDKSNIIQIQKFSSNPLEYLRKINPIIVNLYEKN